MPTDREIRHRELAEQYLPDVLLETFRARAAVHDQENSFAHDDIADLKATGYLNAFVPTQFGGGGLNLQEISRLQQRLATAAPGTALAVNMHLLCTGVVRAMYERGDDSLTHVFDETAAGEIFAFGISEPSNDWVLQGSNSQAVPQGDGSYLITGTKIFTSLTPVWTRLITHALDESDPEHPTLVYGFVERDAAGVQPSDNWNVMGMRPSHSRSTRLENVLMRADRVARRIPAGRHPDLLTFAITCNFQLLVASVYAGVARRALELATTALKTRTSAKAGVPLAEVGEYRVRLADAHLDFLPAPAQIDAVCRDFDELVDHGAGWLPRIVSARIQASRAARRTAEAALLMSGGRAFAGDSEVSRVYRDAAAGLFHPPSEDAARLLFAASLLDD